MCIFMRAAATDLGTTPAVIFTLGKLKADATTTHSLTSPYRDCMSVQSASASGRTHITVAITATLVLCRFVLLSHFIVILW